MAAVPVVSIEAPARCGGRRRSAARRLDGSARRACCCCASNATRRRRGCSARKQCPRGQQAAGGRRARRALPAFEAMLEDLAQPAAAADPTAICRLRDREGTAWPDLCVCGSPVCACVVLYGPCGAGCGFSSDAVESTEDQKEQNHLESSYCCHSHAPALGTCCPTMTTTASPSIRPYG